ncbi:MAG: hypothetical protein LPK80_11875, partial [Bacteroidota bacterium]|nr:hypothetical protein [Bacteroidota bacterium]
MIFKLNDSLRVLDSLDLSGFDRPIYNHQVLVQRILPFDGDTLIALVNQLYPDSSFSGLYFPNVTSNLLFFDSNLNVFDTISFNSDSVFFHSLFILKEK